MSFHGACANIMQDMYQRRGGWPKNSPAKPISKVVSTKHGWGVFTKAYVQPPFCILGQAEPIMHKLSSYVG